MFSLNNGIISLYSAYLNRYLITIYWWQEDDFSYFYFDVKQLFKPVAIQNAISVEPHLLSVVTHVLKSWNSCFYNTDDESFYRLIFFYSWNWVLIGVHMRSWMKCSNLSSPVDDFFLSISLCGIDSTYYHFIMVYIYSL